MQDRSGVAIELLQLKLHSRTLISIIESACFYPLFGTLLFAFLLIMYNIMGNGHNKLDSSCSVTVRKA